MNAIELQSKQKHVELFLELALAVKTLQKEFNKTSELSKVFASGSYLTEELFPLVRLSGKQVRELSISVMQKADILWDSINDSITSASKLTEEQYDFLKENNPTLAEEFKNMPHDILKVLQGFKIEFIKQTADEFNANGLLTVEQSIKLAELTKAFILDLLAFSGTIIKLFDLITDIDADRKITDALSQTQRKTYIQKIFIIASTEVHVAMKLATYSQEMLKAVYLNVDLK